jgi:hypothetical protein
MEHLLSGLAGILPFYMKEEWFSKVIYLSMFLSRIAQAGASAPADWKPRRAGALP